MTMGLKEAFLQKGWAGKTLSRTETIERLNPLLERMLPLMHTHRYVIDHVSDATVSEQLETMHKTLRADIGKVTETVLSCGGVPYTGVELDPAAVRPGDTDDAMLFTALDEEQAFHDALQAEADQPHQMRTRAILGAVAANSAARLDALKALTLHRRRPHPVA